jgi:hypothetical protein
MKKILPTLLAFLLVASMNPAQAAVKAGAKCTKAGATASVGGKKYTCIKSGKKLVWNKGTTIKKVVSFDQGVCPPASGADKTAITQARANTLISMSEDQGQQCSELLGWAYRVGQRDDEYFALTKDYNPSRVTVSIKDGFVLSVLVG